MVTPSIFPLKIKNASVVKRGTTILNALSLELAVSGITIIMGPNGSGKTTLLRLMHGLERPQSGSVEWNCASELARQKQAFVFQTPVMMRRSALDNIAYPLKLQGASKSEANAKSIDWMNKINLASQKNLTAKDLSGGERQKLALARALVTDPEVLFLDEPTTNLDGTSTKEIEAILQDASSGGIRLIMTTHDVGQARRLASDVIFLNKGAVCEWSDATKFFSNPASSAAQSYLKGDIVE